MPQTAGKDRDEYFLMESYMMHTERAGRVLCHHYSPLRIEREREENASIVKIKNK